MIYPESARRIIRDTPPEQADTLLPEVSVFMAFKMSSYCHDNATLHWNNNRTLKATTSGLSSTGMSNHWRGIPRAGKYICREQDNLWLSKHPIIALMQGCIIMAITGCFESHKYPHFWQKRVSACLGGVSLMIRRTNSG